MQIEKGGEGAQLADFPMTLKTKDVIMHKRVQERSNTFRLTIQHNYFHEVPLFTGHIFLQDIYE